MKLNILNIDHHRNGVDGAPFHAIIFRDKGQAGSVKLGIVFDEPGHIAVLDIAKLADCDVECGSNSWHGDDYEPALRRAVQHDREVDPEAELDGKALIPQRIDKCDAVLRQYSGDVFSGLTDLLADAMHWSDATGEDFHYALCLAGKHYVAELNDEQLDERKLP